MIVSYKQSGALLAIIMGLLFAGGCKTTESSEEAAVTPAPKIVFAPQIRRAIVQSGTGRYPNLFTGASYAVWGGEVEPPAPPVGMPMPEKASADTKSVEARMDTQLDSVPPIPEAQAARAAGLTIECHLESEFPDRSIAYDAVGLRGMTILLKLPDGREIQPAQKTLASDLSEIPVGALRRYGRKLTLYFSESQFMVDNPAVNPDSPGVRLVVNGLESQFYFEWATTPNFLAVPAPRLDEKVSKFARKQLKATHEVVSRTSHNLD